MTGELNMRSIPLAMTWEMLHRGRWLLIGAVLAVNSLPVLVLTALRHEGGVDPGDPSLLMMHIVMTQCNMLAFGAAVLAVQGNPARLYAFPIPTTTLVTWQLLPGMAIIALQSLASTAALNALFRLD